MIVLFFADRTTLSFLKKVKLSDILEKTYCLFDITSCIILYACFHMQTQLFPTLIIIRNIYWAPNQHIRLIMWRSCDTEDWSNDAENTAAHHRNKLHDLIME